jgi:hypothetical protein
MNQILSRPDVEYRAIPCNQFVDSGDQKTPSSLSSASTQLEAASILLSRRWNIRAMGNPIYTKGFD